MKNRTGMAAVLGVDYHVFRSEGVPMLVSSVPAEQVIQLRVFYGIPLATVGREPTWLSQKAKYPRFEEILETRPVENGWHWCDGLRGLTETSLVFGIKLKTVRLYDQGFRAHHIDLEALEKNQVLKETHEKKFMRLHDFLDPDSKAVLKKYGFGAPRVLGVLCLGNL